METIALHFHATAAEFRGDELWLENCDCPNTGYQAGWSKSMYSKAFALSMINR